MNIHEYQAKEILRAFGVPTGKGIAAFTVDEAAKAAGGIRRGLVRARGKWRLLRNAGDKPFGWHTAPRVNGF